MRSLDPLAIDEGVNYSEFASHHLGPRRTTLDGMNEAIMAAYDGYAAAVVSNEFTPLELSPQEADALESNYPLTQGGKAMGRIRDAILGLAFHGRCPYCDTAQVGTLDHYLPKGEYEEFCVLSLNLIPSCHRCNNMRGEALRHEDGTRVWHAYLDAVPVEAILFAQVSPRENTLAVSFTIQNSAGVELPVFQQLEYLYESLHLGDFFQVEAAAALFDLAPSASRVHTDGGHEAVRHLFSTWAADIEARQGRNHWRSALHRALSQIADFSDPAFDQLVRAAVPAA